MMFGGEKARPLWAPEPLRSRWREIDEEAIGRSRDWARRWARGRGRGGLRILRILDEGHPVYREIRDVPIRVRAGRVGCVFVPRFSPQQRRMGLGLLPKADALLGRRISQGEPDARLRPGSRPPQQPAGIFQR